MIGTRIARTSGTFRISGCSIGLTPFSAWPVPTGVSSEVLLKVLLASSGKVAAVHPNAPDYCFARMQAAMRKAFPVWMILSFWLRIDGFPLDFFANLLTVLFLLAILAISVNSCVSCYELSVHTPGDRVGVFKLLGLLDDAGLALFAAWCKCCVACGD
jgi:hypothetical protein